MAATNHNGLIEEHPQDTIENVRAVLAFLAWSKTTEPDVEHGGQSLRGEYLVLQACQDALENALGNVERPLNAKLAP